ncbi:unnamed protein product [Polarella glacialis]|nr:unnamed protein product [Polarella glacialis]
MGGTEAWEDAANAVAAAIDSGTDEAEMALAKAFGWTGWFDLNRASYLKPKLPQDIGKLREALRWLSDGPLSLSPEQLRHALAIKPLAYLVGPEKSYHAALEVAPEQFSTPSAFRDLLLREPMALDLTHNCQLTDPDDRPMDDWGEPVHCDGQCTHCWRSSTPRFMGGVLDGVEV